MKKRLTKAFGVLGLTITAFCANSAVPNIGDFESSAYKKAIEEKNFDSIHFFVNNGANVDVRNQDGQTPLMLAILENKLDSVRFLLDHGADPNLHANDDTTPLMYAVVLNNFSAVKLLVNYNALIDVKTYDNMTAISLAQARKYWNIVGYLITERTNQRHLIVQSILDNIDLRSTNH